MVAKNVLYINFVTISMKQKNVQDVVKRLLFGNRENLEHRIWSA